MLCIIIQKTDLQYGVTDQYRSIECGSSTSAQLSMALSCLPNNRLWCLRVQSSEEQRYNYPPYQRGATVTQYWVL